MNWFYKIITAQIWRIDKKSGFSESLVSLYELEYKLDALKRYNFYGHPKRRENIIKGLENSLDIIYKKIKINHLLILLKNG